MGTTSLSAPTDRNAILLGIWIAGVVVNLAGLVLGFWRLHRIASRAAIVRDGPWADAARQLSEHFRLRAPVTLLQSDRPAVLVTWGFFAPRVMLPRDAESWDVDRIRVVLAHELAHVQRRDWIVQIGSELLRIACWFNPLVWLAASRLRLESERACDDAVVNLGVSGRDYALHLLELARQFGRARDVFPAVAIVPRPSSLERRVTAMLNPRLSRRPLSVTTRFGTIAALLAIALPIALFAQNRFSTLSGSVMDPSGGLLPGVTVAAIDTTRGVRHEMKTNRTGQFEIIGVAEGPHVLQATLPGFQTFELKLTLDGQDVNRNITLRVGSLQETVSVTRGGSPSVVRGPALFTETRRLRCVSSRPGWSCDRDAPLRIGGQIRQPTKTRHVSPVYPEGPSAGIVILEAVIGPEGLVTDAKVLRTPGTGARAVCGDRGSSVGVHADAPQLCPSPSDHDGHRGLQLDLDSRERPRAEREERRRHNGQHHQIGRETDLGDADERAAQAVDAVRQRIQPRRDASTPSADCSAETARPTGRRSASPGSS